MRPLRIAIADDDDSMREWIADALSGDYIEVFHAHNGAELIRLLADQGPFDLLVTDLSMPWMDGMQVVAAARTAGLNTPVLFVTAHHQDGLAKVVSRFDDVILLRKPIALTDLLISAAELLERRH